MKRLVVTAALAFLAQGCGDDSGASDDDGAAAQGGQTAASASASVGSGGGGGGGEYVPSAADIGFSAIAPLPSGEQILFNDWSAPDRLLSMAPDGADAVEIFSVYRIWSMGVARGADRLAFACGDPQQEEHYGVTIGDAIQHTFLYDVASQSVEVLAYGNINDECHHFGPGDDALYVCRRYDFSDRGTFGGYRLGVLATADGSFEFLVPDEAMVYTLHPQEVAGELYYTRIALMPGMQERSIERMTLPSGAPETVRESAQDPLIAPGGGRYLYADLEAASALYESDLDGDNSVLVVNRAGTSASYSPAGDAIAYLIYDDDAQCSHVEVVATDGSESETPTRIRDCVESGEFITQLAWIIR
jgi:hypothetical protein